ncbi:MAG: response regulator, partial [Anaerolineae bacterium]
MMEERIKILLVEDDKVDQMAFERFVERENLPYDYAIAGSISEARDVLTTERFDIALIDYLLGDGTAFDLFDEIGDIPIIVITGTGDEAIAVQAMKSGAYDYLIKDLQGNYLVILPVTVEGALRHRRAEDELRRYREHLEELVEERAAELIRVNEQLLAEIAERKRAEEALQEYSERLEEMVEQRTQELRDTQERLIRKEK